MAAPASHAEQNERPPVLRALVTGFGPFPGVPDNPSGQLARRIARAMAQARSRRKNVSIATAVLPTEWRALPRHLDRLAARYRPDLTLHFGVHERAQDIHVEQQARNFTSQRPDALTQTPLSPVIARFAPAALASPLDGTSIAASLRRRGLRARVSNDAGDYLCNMAYFLSLARGRFTVRQRPALFVHIPPLEPTEPNADWLLEAGLTVLDQAIHQTRKNLRRAGARPTGLAPELLGVGSDNSWSPAP